MIKKQEIKLNFLILEKKSLKTSIKNQIENEFKKEMKELGYL